MSVSTHENRQTTQLYLPVVEIHDGLGTLSVKDPNEVREDGLPDTELKLVQEVDDEEREEVQSRLAQD